MTIIDITKDYLELFVAKKDIEELLIENKTIDKEFDISAFINYINFGTHIYYVSSDLIYPFKIISGKKDTYMFVVTDDNTKNISNLLNALEEIKFDLNKLEHKDAISVASENLIEKPHFIINSELYYNMSECV